MNAKRLGLSFWLTLIFLFAVSGHVKAQDISIAAWLENEQIIVRATKDGSQSLQNAEIIIFNTPGKKQITSGRTDTAGFFVFNVPESVREGSGIVIDVNAGNGAHKEWSMTAAELYAASSLTVGFDESVLSGQNGSIATAPLPPVSQLPAPAMPAPAGGQSGVTAEEVKNIVTELLQEKLEPVLQEMKPKDPGTFTYQEVLGGIGWLIGLCGIIFFFMARRRS